MLRKEFELDNCNNNFFLFHQGLDQMVIAAQNGLRVDVTTVGCINF